MGYIIGSVILEVTSAIFFLSLLVRRTKKTTGIKSYDLFQEKPLVRYCSKAVMIDDHTVHLKPSGDANSNSTNRGKPTLWFFAGEPSLWTQSKNAITSKEIKVTVSPRALDLDCLTFRSHDRAVGYTKEYRGPAKIVYISPANACMKSRIFRFMNKPVTIYVSAAMFVGVPLTYIIYFGLTA